MEEEQPKLTPEEEVELADYIAGQQYPKAEEKNDIVSFFKKIINIKDDSSKIGYLNEQELYAIRILLDVAKYAYQINYEDVGEFIIKKAEVLLGTSVSRDGFLIQSAISKRSHTFTRIRTGGNKKWPKKE